MLDDFNILRKNEQITTAVLTNTKNIKSLKPSENFMFDNIGISVP